MSICQDIDYLMPKLCSILCNACLANNKIIWKYCLGAKMATTSSMKSVNFIKLYGGFDAILDKKFQANSNYANGPYWL